MGFTRQVLVYRVFYIAFLFGGFRHANLQTRNPKTAPYRGGGFG